MLPPVDELFTLVRSLATRARVTDVAAPKWLVQRHRLGPLLARSGVLRFRDDLVRATLEWARAAQDLPTVVAALRARGVRVAPVKGTAYATQFYTAPAERPMVDHDLLVRSVDRAAAEQVLAGLGFEPARHAALHHAAPWHRGDLSIDLHWNIIAPGRSHIDLDAVWSRTSLGWPDGAEQLEPVDALAFHLIHLARNRLRLPLINVVDAARLLEHAHANSALARATSWGLGTSVSLALRFCTAILEDRPGAPAGWLGPSRMEAALLADASATKKVTFDVASAGSPRQLVSRLVQVAANKLR